MRWSVLDQSPTSAGFSEETAIRNSLELARDCDRLGYERYWLSEHHNLASVAGTAPEMLAAAIAVTFDPGGTKASYVLLAQALGLRDAHEGSSPA